MYVVDDFLTAEQCDSVITLAEPRLERSQTSTTANISSTKTRSRTSSGTWPGVRVMLTRIWSEGSSSPSLFR